MLRITFQTLNGKIESKMYQENEPIDIGRRLKSAFIRIPSDVRLSSHHGQFIYNGKLGLFVIDCNSSNGTFVNDVKLQPNEKCPIHFKQKVVMGNTWFRIEKHIEEFSVPVLADITCMICQRSLSFMRLEV